MTGSPCLESDDLHFGLTNKFSEISLFVGANHEPWLFVTYFQMEFPTYQMEMLVTEVDWMAIE